MIIIRPLLRFLLAACGIACLQTAIAAEGFQCVITTQGIGPIQRGMSLRQARQQLPTFSFQRTADADGVALVAVSQAKENWMTVYADEEDANRPIDWAKKIDVIETFHPGCKTVGGVRPGMLVKDVEKVFGPLVEITQSEIEARQYIQFRNQPAHFLFRIDDTVTFPEGVYSMKTYPPGTKILAIAIVQK